MMQRFFILAFCFLAVSGLWGQKTSKADQLYFEYSYQEAITAYKDEMRKYKLSSQQELNLAEAYFKTGQYDQAAEAYMEVYKKDSLMTNTQFNTMLQALSRTSGPERAKAYLNTRTNLVSQALLQNATFNYETLEDASAANTGYTIIETNLNSPQSDFAPAFYGPDRLLFSSGRPTKSKPNYNPSAESYLSIYSVSAEANFKAVQPTPFAMIPETDYHQATPYYSESLKQVFYVQSNLEDGELAFDENGKNALGICRAGQNGSFDLLFRDYSTSFYYPFYDETSGRLYFAADFGEGYGGTDLYFVYSNNGQIMSEPVNLGPHINTPGNEIAPFLFDGSLYFSSDAFYGLGGMDIYKSEIQEGDFYSIPVNLGPGINTNKDDFGFIIRKAKEEGYEGYFASNRPGGRGSDDIYAFTALEKPGLKTLAFRGTIRDQSGLGIEKAYVRLYQGDSTLIKETYTSMDGEFRLEIPMRDSVRVALGKQGYETVDLGNTATDQNLISGQPLDISLTALERIVVRQSNRILVRMDDFHFERNSKSLTPEITTILDEAAEQLKKFPVLRLQVEAHTDSRGYKSTNQKLSEERGIVIRDYLIAQGVAPEVFTEVKGFGETQIVNNCSDGVYCLDMLHKQNERYLFIVLNYDEL
ncbi:OmpA family protein [Robiginitalea sp.]|uniref:OmpA family protein n=1 Tax=Robiginitalea sp. TaxID=1902411 RepID=UPI003C7811DE